MKLRSVHWFTLCCAILLLLAFGLSACGGSAASNSSANTTPTASNADETVNLTYKTYRGNGFSIAYPQTWNVTPLSGGAPLAEFSDGQNHLEVQGGTTSAATMLKTITGQFGTTYKVDNSIPHTVTLNGVTWQQQAGTFNSPQTGQPLHFIIWTAKNPHQSARYKTFGLFCMSYEPDFNNGNEIYHQMLQSFSFQ
jgi:hypothetical protein